MIGMDEVRRLLEAEFHLARKIGIEPSCHEISPGHLGLKLQTGSGDNAFWTTTQVYDDEHKPVEYNRWMARAALVEGVHIHVDAVFS